MLTLTITCRLLISTGGHVWFSRCNRKTSAAISSYQQWWISPAANVTLAVFLAYQKLLPLPMETGKSNKEKMRNSFWLVGGHGEDIGEWKVEIRRRIVLTLAIFERKWGPVSLFRGLFKNFWGLPDISESPVQWYYFWTNLIWLGCRCKQCREDIEYSLGISKRVSRSFRFCSRGLREPPCAFASLSKKSWAFLFRRPPKQRNWVPEYLGTAHLWSIL